MNGKKEHSINTSSNHIGEMYFVHKSLNNSRCKKCNKLLFKGKVNKDYIEIKCLRCGHINIFGSLKNN